MSRRRKEHRDQMRGTRVVSRIEITMTESPGQAPQIKILRERIGHKASIETLYGAIRFLEKNGEEEEPKAEKAKDPKPSLGPI